MWNSPPMKRAVSALPLKNWHPGQVASGSLGKQGPAQDLVKTMRTRRVPRFQRAGPNWAALPCWHHVLSFLDDPQHRALAAGINRGTASVPWEGELDVRPSSPYPDAARFCDSLLHFMARGRAAGVQALWLGDGGEDGVSLAFITALVATLGAGAPGLRHLELHFWAQSARPMWLLTWAPLLAPLRHLRCIVIRQKGSVDGTVLSQLTALTALQVTCGGRFSCRPTRPWHGLLQLVVESPWLSVRVDMLPSLQGLALRVPAPADMQAWGLAPGGLLGMCSPVDLGACAAALQVLQIGAGSATYPGVREPALLRAMHSAVVPPSHLCLLDQAVALRSLVLQVTEAELGDSGQRALQQLAALGRLESVTLVPVGVLHGEEEEEEEAVEMAGRELARAFMAVRRAVGAGVAVLLDEATHGELQLARPSPLDDQLDD